MSIIATVWETAFNNTIRSNSHWMGFHTFSADLYALADPSLDAFFIRNLNMSPPYAGVEMNLK